MYLVWRYSIRSLVVDNFFFSNNKTMIAIWEAACPRYVNHWKQIVVIFFFIVSDEILSAFMDNIKLSHSICICKFVWRECVCFVNWVSQNYTRSQLFRVFFSCFSKIRNACVELLSVVLISRIVRILTLTQRIEHNVGYKCYKYAIDF